MREVGRRAATEVERRSNGRVLDHTNGDRKQAARIPRVRYTALLQKIGSCSLVRAVTTQLEK